MMGKNINEQIRDARQLRDIIMKDKHRPRYHFIIPEGMAIPFDPQVYYWKGKYHLFYLFQQDEVHCIGHASSIDILHWTYHPAALVPSQAGADDDGKCWSGCVIDKDGLPTIMYIGNKGSTCMAFSEDDDLIQWTKYNGNPIIPQDKYAGDHAASAWKDGEDWYCIRGGHDNETGDTVYLYKSRDFINWEYLHPFYQSSRKWTEKYEDNACPDFFPFGDRYMLMFISHAKGLQYYIGRYENEHFYPESHGRMNWPGGQCFANESLLDDKGRRIFWAWVNEAQTYEMRKANGWSGVYSLPRVLSPGQNGQIYIQPVEELKSLRYNYRRHANIDMKSDKELLLEDIQGDCMEISMILLPGNEGKIGINICCSEDNCEKTSIYYDCQSGDMCIDTSKTNISGDSYQPIMPILSVFPNKGEGNGWVKKHKDLGLAQECWLQRAPLDLGKGEMIQLDIFVDRSILEVFANERICLTQRIYPSRMDSKQVRIFSKNGNGKVLKIDAWDMAATNQW